MTLRLLCCYKSKYCHDCYNQKKIFILPNMCFAPINMESQ